MPIPLPRILPAVLALLAWACGGSPTEPGRPDADVVVLFIGNSLTYTNDLPGLVETVAEAAGRSLGARSVAGPDFALSDHWQTGAPAEIRRLRPDLVLLQQGPSTLASSREHLLAWSDSLARVAREVGARVGLLMVWPPDDPRYTFGAVHASYRAAADHVEGLYVPAGLTWVEAWKSDGTLPLYGPDRFHPSRLGSVAAALTVVETLFEGSVETLPARMRRGDGRGPEIVLDEATRTVLVAAVARAVERYAVR